MSAKHDRSPGPEFWQCPRCNVWYHYAFADCLCDGHKGIHTPIDVPKGAKVVGDPGGVTMTKLEDVLAEEWEIENGCFIRKRGDHLVGDFGESEQSRNGECGFWRDSETGDTRAAVAVLGKRALPLLIKHEYADWESYTKEHRCAECGGYPSTGGHRNNCEWGRIVEEARSIG